jgi:hypothetical protein
MNRGFIVALIALSCLHATGAQAQAGYRGAFFGIAGGPSKMSFDSDSLQGGSGPGASTLATEGSSTAFKGYGGFRFSKNFAVEGGLASLGRFTATRDYAGPGGGTLKADVTVIGGYGNAVGIIPVSEHFEIFGKGGLMVTGVIAQYTTTGGVLPPAGAPTVVAYRTGLHLGAGMEVRFDRKVGLIVEYEEVIGVGDSQTTGGGNIGTTYVGLTFRF